MIKFVKYKINDTKNTNIFIKIEFQVNLRKVAEYLKNL